MTHSHPDPRWQLLGPAHNPSPEHGSVTPRAQLNFRPVLEEQWPVCPSEAPPAAAALRTRAPLLGLAGPWWSCRYFLPSASIRAPPAPWGHTAPAPAATRDPQGPGTPWGHRRGCRAPAGRWPCSRGTPAAKQLSTTSPPPAMHILLEKISLLRFQVPAEMRLKNVQNAVFSSFPLCVSQHVLQTGHFLIVLLWLSRAGIREAFIFTRRTGLQISSWAERAQELPVKIPARAAGAEAGRELQGPQARWGGAGCPPAWCRAGAGGWRPLCSTNS